MLRLYGAQRKLEEHDKDVSSYMAGGAGDAEGENIVEDMNRQRTPQTPNMQTAKPFNTTLPQAA